MAAAAPFDRVLADAHEHERRRLRRYRTRWLLQQAAVILVACGVLVASVPALIGSDDGLASWSLVGFFLVGGWIGYVALIGLVGVSLLVLLVALGRIVALLRADDVAAFERTHRPWWVDASR